MCALVTGVQTCALPIFSAAEQTFHSMPLSGGGWSRSLTGVAPAISADRQQQPWSPWRSPLSAATALPVVSPRRLAPWCPGVTLATEAVTFLDRKRSGTGKSVSERVDPGGGRALK